MHPTEYAFASGAADNIKKFRLPMGEFLHNMLQNQRAIINCAAVNEDGVMATGADNGSLWCARCPAPTLAHFVRPRSAPTPCVLKRIAASV